MGASTPHSRAGLVSKKQRRKGQTSVAPSTQPADGAADFMDSPVKVAKYAYPKASDALLSYGPATADSARLGSTDRQLGAGMCPLSVRHVCRLVLIWNAFLGGRGLCRDRPVPILIQGVESRQADITHRGPRLVKPYSILTSALLVLVLMET